MRRLSDSHKGFTLVEVIVVLVVLAILAAILVPSLTGYIQKAKDKTAIVEARSAVEAVTTLSSEKYAVGEQYSLSDDLDATLALAETPQGATITAVVFGENKATLNKLVYQTADGTVVTYEDGQYTIGATNTVQISDREKLGNVILSSLDEAGYKPKNNLYISSADTSPEAEKLRESLKAQGFDLDELGAEAWVIHYHTNVPKLFWATQPLVTGNNKTNYLIAYSFNKTGHNYNVWQIKSSIDEEGKVTAWSEVLRLTPGEKEKQTYENAVKVYNELISKE